MTRYSFLPALVFLFSIYPSTTPAADQTTPSFGLKEIMQGLRDDTLVITDGLLNDNMEQVVQGATGIAHHASIPPEQVQLVAAELGPEMPAFKSFDQQVHHLSEAIISAAKSGDRERLTSDFKQMISGCLACHAAYKERVAGVLGGAGK